MALGYGSEFHLLRFMGRHRKTLDKAIQDVLSMNDKIDWLDFPYNNTLKEYDKEYIGINFLEKQQDYNQTEEEWGKFWPNKTKAMNWDAVGRIGDQWLLVEAKAHAGELKSDSKAGIKSRIAIQDKFIDLGTEKGIDTTGWLKKYYQKANRLLFLDFLQTQGLDVKMIFIYFLNGYEIDTKKNMKTIAEWEESIKKQDKYLNISNNAWVKQNVINVFIDTRWKRVVK